MAVKYSAMTRKSTRKECCRELPVWCKAVQGVRGKILSELSG